MANRQRKLHLQAASIFGGGILILVLSLLHMPFGQSTDTSADSKPRIAGANSGSATSTSTTTPSVPPAAQSPTGAGCKTLAPNVYVHFYDANKTKSVNFGAPIDPSADVQAETEATRQADPYITATHMAQMGWESAKPEDMTHLGEHYKQNPIDWGRALTRLCEWEKDPNTTVSIEDITGPYASYYMVAGIDQQSVEIRRDNNVVPDSGAKMVVYRNGDTVIKRALGCRLQPMELGDKPLPDRFTPTPQPNRPGTSTPPGTGGCQPNCPTTPPNPCDEPECLPSKPSAPQPTGVTSPPRPNPPSLEPSPPPHSEPLTPSGPTTTTTTPSQPNQGGDNTSGRVTG